LELFLITKTTEKIGLVKRDDQIVELVIDRPDAPQLVGSIYLGKVIKVDESLQAAFVDIGQQELGYLEKKQIPAARKDREASISTFLYEGESILVQVTKDAYQEKGAQLTMNLTIANQALVYLPYGDYLAVSKKLPKKTADELKAELTAFRKGEEGLIIRTVAKDYSVDQLHNHWRQLRTNWENIFAKANESKAPTVIWSDHAVTDRLIRRFPAEKITRIYVDHPSVATEIKKRFLELEEKVTWVNQMDELITVSVPKVIESILNPEVIADSGVTLVIDQTEALTVIDVNSSGFTGKMNQHQFAYKVNRLAVDEIARQIRLRNLSGMIIIDFLRMKDKKEKNKIINQLRNRLKDDPTRSEVYGFTDLGLLELTRKREAPNHLLSLAGNLQKRLVLSKKSKAYSLERELIMSEAEAVIVEVTKGFYQVWKEWIEPDVLKESVKTRVYFIETKGVKDYLIKRVGSQELIDEFLLENKQLKVDKLN